MIMHAKYPCSIINTSEDMSQVKVFVTDRRWDEVNLLFNVTIYDISVIYVTAHRCAGGLKKLYLRSGSHRHRHFVGFFNVSVQAPTRGHPFLHGCSEKPPHLVAFYDHAGDTEDTFST